MIYDCFTFFNENDLLEIRFNVLKDTVDKFVIIEATKTFTGKEKALNFDKDRFKEFQDKIEYIVLDEFPKTNDAWVYENVQRNHIYNVLCKFCKDDDIVIISDCDEIPSVNAINDYKKNPVGIKSLEQELYYYYLNLKNFKGTYWYGARILTFKEFNINNSEYKFDYNNFLPEEYNKNMTPNKIRMLKNCPRIKNGGWHFSFLGGTDKIIEKCKNYSHQEFNNEKFLNKENIENCIIKGKDLFGRKNFKLLPVKIDESFPEYIRENVNKYNNIIFPYPENNLIFLFKICFYKFLNFIYFKEKDGNKRIIKILGIKFQYKHK